MIEYIILGLIQGITEWLPISSQGQTYIVAQMFGLPLESLAGVALWLHMGTVLAALVYFRNEIVTIFQKKNRFLLRFLLIATIMTGVVGLPLYLAFKSIMGAFAGGAIIGVIGVLLIVTGLAQRQAKAKHREFKEVGLRDSIITGLAQGFSVLPGISRSGTTSSVLLFSGFESKAALRLSFLMSIPAVLAAGVGFEVIEGFEVSSGAIVALLVAFVTGLVTIDLLIKVAEKVKFWKFCIALGLISLVPFLMSL